MHNVADMVRFMVLQSGIVVLVRYEMCEMVRNGMTWNNARDGV